MKKITVQTKLISLLGYPLTQTHAPQQFNDTFTELGLDYFYFPIETENDDLGTIISAIRCMNYAGFNVTKPNKIKVIEYLDELDELAEKIGSVNVVRLRDGVLRGYNTDGIGFLQSLWDETDLILEETSFLIFGAGGASRAVAMTLAFHGAQHLTILDAVDAAAESLVNDINARVRMCAEFVPFEGAPLPRLVGACDVLVNGAGVGMYPHTDRTPVAKDLLRPDLFVADFTYNPLRTRLLREAEEVGCRVMNGVGMSINQGIKGFSLITGEPEQTEVMTRVVKGIIAGKETERTS